MFEFTHSRFLHRKEFVLIRRIIWLCVTSRLIHEDMMTDFFWSCQIRELWSFSWFFRQRRERFYNKYSCSRVLLLRRWMRIFRRNLNRRNQYQQNFIVLVDDNFSMKLLRRRSFEEMSEILLQQLLQCSRSRLRWAFSASRSWLCDSFLKFSRLLYFHVLLWLFL